MTLAEATMVYNEHDETLADRIVELEAKLARAWADRNSPTPMEAKNAELEQLRIERDSIRVLAGQLAAALAMVEWALPSNVCPWCHGMSPYNWSCYTGLLGYAKGHLPECRFQAALAAANAAGIEVTR